ncbi:MAG: D-tyrosyl-tRNA(Tyr) deacylase [Chloroflexi bacterium]|nr:D-tyrosyl-tRNA(Tyr) deacylase [Chloroflexota bacterium]
MRALIQRVTEAKVTVEADVVGAIGAGYLILLGVGQEDTPTEATQLAEKIVNLRLFSDEAGKFNHSLLDVGGAVLVVSQFTLFADTRKGRRPSFVQAAAPDRAVPLIDHFCATLRSHGVVVETGRFGAMMQVQLVNDGPVTIWLDTVDAQRPRRSVHGGAPPSDER